MKQDIATYLVDSFVDYKGDTHHIVACALSQSPKQDSHTLRVGWADKANRLDVDDHLFHEVYRMVTVGIAICNPEDNFDYEKGKQIAYHKAANIENLPRIYAPCKGVITKDLVDTFLKQQVTFFKEHPEALIEGYAEKASAHQELEKAKAEIANLDETEKEIFDLAVKGWDFTRYIRLAEIYVNKIFNKD